MARTRHRNWASRLLVPATGVLALAGACGSNGLDSIGFDSEDVAGSGAIVAENRQVSGFDRVVFESEGDVTLTLGAAESLSITADDNIVEHIETDVEGRTLTIRTARGIDIEPTGSITYEIGLVELAGLELVGVGSMAVEDWSAAAANVQLTGVGDIRVDDLRADRLDIALSGVGSITVAGIVDHQAVDLSGVGSYDGADLETRTASIVAGGEAAATVWVTDELDAVAEGNGRIAYYGSPDSRPETSDLGTIRRLGPRR